MLGETEISMFKPSVAETSLKLRDGNESTSDGLCLSISTATPVNKRPGANYQDAFWQFRPV